MNKNVIKFCFIFLSLSLLINLVLFSGYNYSSLSSFAPSYIIFALVMSAFSTSLINNKGRFFLFLIFSLIIGFVVHTTAETGLGGLGQSIIAVGIYILTIVALVVYLLVYAVEKIYNRYLINKKNITVIFCCVSFVLLIINIIDYRNFKNTSVPGWDHNPIRLSDSQINNSIENLKLIKDEDYFKSAYHQYYEKTDISNTMQDYLDVASSECNKMYVSPFLSKECNIASRLVLVNKIADTGEQYIKKSIELDFVFRADTVWIPECEDLLRQHQDILLEDYKLHSQCYINKAIFIANCDIPMGSGAPECLSALAERKKDSRICDLILKYTSESNVIDSCLAHSK